LEAGRKGTIKLEVTVSKFGKYAIVSSVEHHFSLEPDWYWTIKPITSGMELERSKFLMHNRSIQDVDGKRRELPPTWLETAYREIALSFGGTNIPDEKDEPALKPDALVADIEKFLREAPQALVWEIWVAIGESYSYWGPVDPNAYGAPKS
jgi:hypothetical protein